MAAYLTYFCLKIGQNEVKSIYVCIPLCKTSFYNAKLPQKYIQDKGGWYFFKNNCKTTLYMVTPGGQIPKYLPNMTENIGIMQITSQFGPFDNLK